MSISRTTRTIVRVCCPECVDGGVRHMTADELLARAIHDQVSLACPRCGRIHLDIEEIETLNRMKIVDSQRYWQLRLQAEA